MTVQGYIEYGTCVAADVPNNSIFRDAADGILKIKDNTGTLINLN